MEFKSSRLGAMFGGVICAIIGVTMFVLAITVDDPEAPLGALALFGLLGIVLTIGSSTLFTFRHSVRIDRRRMLVERKMSAIFWSQTKRFRIRDFQEVSIMSFSGGNGHSYRVVLRGPKTITLPGTGSGGYDAILARAKKVAELTGLSLDENS